MARPLILFADASFSSGGGSPWPLVAALAAIVALFAIYAWLAKD